MVRRYCNRCGKEISSNPMTQCQNSLFDIRYNSRELMSIDLCEDCSKEFVSWVTGKRGMVKQVELINEHGEISYGFLDDQKMLVFTKWDTVDYFKTLGVTIQDFDYPEK